MSEYQDDGSSVLLKEETNNRFGTELFAPHHDYHEPDATGKLGSSVQGEQRAFTVLLLGATLPEGAGGETNFPRAPSPAPSFRPEQPHLPSSLSPPPPSWSSTSPRGKRRGRGWRCRIAGRFGIVACAYL